MPSYDISYLLPIASSAYLSGAIFSYSLGGLSAVVDHLAAHPAGSPNRQTAESHSLSIFRALYDTGKRAAPPMAAVSASFSFANAYRLYSVTNSFNRAAQLAVAAGVLNLAIAPFTILVIAPLNDKLFAKEETFRTGKEDEKAKLLKSSGAESTESMLRGWWWLNVCRSLFPMVGMLVATQAMV